MELPKGVNMRPLGDLYLLEAFIFLKPLFLISTNLIKKRGKYEAKKKRLGKGNGCLDGGNVFRFH